ncbi:MAG: hypothetical protein CEE42_07825 [Promethearchaeota archaeon Loki_b31]|nr:MAG: hypothetical protein CEE42_07825 [Candidatus Lokiarchaeota archaeon Loki_b31]
MKERDVHKLIVESGGICNFPECREKFIFQYEDGTFVKLYEFAHIIGESPEGPRGHQTKSKLMAQDPENIILLCVKHHKIVDKNEREYPVEKLKKMKENHIQWVNERLEGLKEATWTLIIHSGNVTGTGVPNLDKELIYRDFYGSHIIAETEEIIIEEFLTETQNWLEYQQKQKEWWQNFKNRDEISKKFLICSINFIPLVIQLGYLIHDTFTADIYQYHREEDTWKWESLHGIKKEQDFYLIERFDNNDLNIQEIALSFSISGIVNDDDIFEVVGNAIKIIKIKVNEPNRTWLKYKEQIINFQKKYIQLIDAIVQQYKNLKKIHLFYAGPTPIAFIIGSSINPTIHPPFILYNYYAKDTPKYTKAFHIN